MGVVLGDDDAGDAFGAGVAVDDIVCNAFQPPLAYIHAHLVGFDIEKVKKKKDIPCSSTLCLCPGFVRSATVLLIMVMNLPYSSRVKRENSLSSCSAHSWMAGDLVLSSTPT